MYKQTYKDLYLARMDDDAKKRCNTPYTYIVSAGAFSHTAFRTFAALLQWAGERGLTLPVLPSGDAWFAAPIVGAYATAMHLDKSALDALQGERIQVLSNAEWTLGIVTREDDGTRTVHYLNPNVRTRVVYPWHYE